MIEITMKPKKYENTLRTKKKNDHMTLKLWSWPKWLGNIKHDYNDLVAKKVIEILLGPKKWL